MRKSSGFCLAGFQAMLLLAACRGSEPANQANASANAAAIEQARSVSVEPVRATLQTAEGSPAGEVTIGEDPNGVKVEIIASGMAPGAHGVHIHAVGKCEGPKFDSAGPHWNPANRKHGRDNVEGAHLGDLANLDIGADGSGQSTFAIGGAHLRDGPMALLDADGAALVIHAKVDDYKTDPSGNSGDRIACAVLGG